MKKGFILLSNLDEQHNKAHRAAFLNPETVYITQQRPSVDNMELGEQRIYRDGSDYWIYVKVAKSTITRVKMEAV